jgi:uncharacterized protein (UPF0332 family)
LILFELNMQWSDFQNTADRLSRGTTEGDWRSAISRSYYAVFHYFREFLLSQRVDIGRGGQSHFNLYSGLQNCGFPAVATIAGRIDDLRAQRVWSDYQLMQPINQQFASAIVQAGRSLIVDFQAALAISSPFQIADGARRHLQAIGRLGKTP